MLFSVSVVVSALSLLSSAHALALGSRQSDCSFVCPRADADGNGLSTFTKVNNTSFSCTYSGAFESPCTFNSSSGAIVGDPDSRCPQQATSQCPVRRRQDGGDDDDKSGDWTPDSYPSWSEPPTPTSSWSKPTQSWSKSPQPWSKPGPSPSPSWSPKPQPPKKEPCNYVCPQKDLVKNKLTDEAIRGPYLFCRYPSQPCEACGFCKYSTKTGLLIEDNDDGNCPQTAPLALPWDRRHD